MPQMCRKLFVAILGLVLCAEVQAAELVAKSGPELYRQFCAACHGSAGRGDGPAASSLQVEVPDLTRFAARRGGFFDRDLVERIIDGRHTIAAHRQRAMPIWGEALSKPYVGDPNAERAARLMVTRLADYLWLLQKPAASSQQSPTQ